MPVSLRAPACPHRHLRSRLAHSGMLVLFAVLLEIAGSAGSSGATPSKQKADRIVIVKSERTLTLLSGGQVLKTYKVALGGDPVGAKEKAGDKKTPEGEYVIDSKNAKSRFHLALDRKST